MSIPGLSQCFGKAAKKSIQNNNKQKQANPPKPQKVRTLPPGFDARVPMQRKQTTVSNQMDMFENSAATGKGAEILKKTNAQPVPPSILRASSPISEGQSVTFNGTVSTHSVIGSPGDGQDLVIKGTRPLADPKKPVLR